MDYDNNLQTVNQPPSGNGMTMAAVILGILSLLTFCFPYITIPAGAGGILFALLSKGYESHMSPRGKLGMGLSIAGLTVTFFFILFTVYLFTGNSKTGQMMQDYYNYYYNDGDSRTSPDVQENPYGSKDLEDWLKDYMNGSGGQGNDSMPQVVPRGSQDGTPKANPAI